MLNKCSYFVVLMTFCVICNASENNDSIVSVKSVGAGKYKVVYDNGTVLFTDHKPRQTDEEIREYAKQMVLRFTQEGTEDEQRLSAENEIE